MRKISVAALSVLFVLAIVGPARAQVGVTRGDRMPLPEAPFSYPAGEVCAFPVSVTNPVQQEFITYLCDDEGNVVGATITGKLIATITNTATGESVDRILTGLGTISFGSDGSRRSGSRGRSWSDFT
jgi:hypothetical protein